MLQCDSHEYQNDFDKGITRKIVSLKEFFFFAEKMKFYEDLKVHEDEEMVIVLLVGENDTVTIAMTEQSCNFKYRYIMSLAFRVVLQDKIRRWKELFLQANNREGKKNTKIYE